MANIEIEFDKFRYVFHHIPRTAGTSAGQVFSRWFKCIEDYRPGWATGEALAKFIASPPQIKNLNPGSMICGHFEVEGCFIEQRFPGLFEDPNVRVITFVRDPLDMAISTYFYERKHGFNRDIALNDYLSRRSNSMAWLFRCDNDSYEEVLDQYFFIGIYEALQRSIDSLAAEVRKPPVTLPDVNSADRDEQVVDSRTRELFLRNNALDYKIYEYCRARYSSQWYKGLSFQPANSAQEYSLRRPARTSRNPV